VALAANVPIIAATAASEVLSDGARLAITRTAILTSVVLLGCLAMQLVGSLALQKAKLGGVMDVISGINGVAMLIFLLAAGFSAQRLFIAGDTGDFGCFTMAGLPFGLAAVFTLVRTTWQVNRALKELEPPEIHHRIQEALKYLE
jgi:hypothetical protein